MVEQFAFCIDLSDELRLFVWLVNYLIEMMTSFAVVLKCVMKMMVS